MTEDSNETNGAAAAIGYGIVAVLGVCFCAVVVALTIHFIRAIV